ncbi:MAG: hypothetical protein Q8P46_05390 [Hyphomicrobiales bacterium]|nr:hypothetical protein [Hyphomicrobiales bacterium]
MRVILLLVSFLAAVLAGTGAMAEEAPSAAERLLRAIEAAPAASGIEEKAWRDYPAPPAEEALAPGVLERYRALLEREDCEAVLPLLLDAYLDRHSEIKGAFVSFSVRSSWIYKVANQAYPEYAFCRARKGLAEELARLGERDVELEPYGGVYPPRQSPSAAGERDAFLRGIELLAYDDHVPAMHYFLMLDSDGRLVRLDPTMRLYLLGRARVIGAPVADHEAREARASAALPPDMTRQIRCMVEKGMGQMMENPAECVRESPQE